MDGLSDIVTIGDCTLYHADCMDVLPKLPKVDAVVTDPPYGLGITKMTLGNGKTKVYRGEEEWDCKINIDFIPRIGIPAIVWGGNYFNLPVYGKWLVWDKGTGDNDFSDCELAWTNQLGAIRKVYVSWVGANAKEKADSVRFHPTQKPIQVIEWCLGHLPGNALTILDPFMGSGTTGVACVNLGRKFIGIEKERKYFDIACERIQRATNQGKLFAT